MNEEIPCRWNRALGKAEEWGMGRGEGRGGEGGLAFRTAAELMGFFLHAPDTDVHEAFVPFLYDE
jgi:hypothetical protein